MKTNIAFSRTCLVICLIFNLVGCVTSPTKIDDLDQDPNNSFSRRVETSTEMQSIEMSYRHSVLQQANVPIVELFRPIANPGDTLRLTFPDMPRLNGLYLINASGNLELPFNNAIKAAGKTYDKLNSIVRQEMIKSQWFYADNAEVELSLVRLAAVNITVLGAVFNPGRVLIGGKPAIKAEDIIQNQAGAFTHDRNLVSALRGSGGIRPDADIKRIFLKRGNHIYQLNLESVILGTRFSETPSLNNGDIVFVSSTGDVRSQLIRPSQITPPGMRIFMSNLTAPALSNAQSAVGADSTRLPYGSSLLDSAISANCIGGTQMANASRSIVLVTRNYGSNQQLVIKRTINELLANSSQTSINPFLMPNDGVACYDSKFTNFRDVARGIGEIISPIIFGGLL